MSKSMKRLLCGFLTVLMLSGTFVTAVNAAVELDGSMATEENGVEEEKAVPEENAEEIKNPSEGEGEIVHDPKIGEQPGAVEKSEEKTQEKTEEEDEGFTTTSLEEIKELLDTVKYSVYLEENADKKDATKSFTVNLAENYLPDDEKSTAEFDKNAKIDDSETSKFVKIEKNYQGKDGSAVYLPEEGSASFKINVPEDGLYTFDMDYYSVMAKATNIQRMLYVDGKILYSELRYLEFCKTWIDELQEDGSFKVDIAGNDIRPTKKQTPAWSDYTLRDSTGLILDEMKVYLTKGEHVISFESVREPVVFRNITFRPAAKAPSYEEVLKMYQQKGYKEVSPESAVTVQAENAIATSDQTVYPLNDRTSPITYPQDAAKIKLNTIGSTKWQNAGQWIKYNVDVEEEGLYQIVVRYKQSELQGMYSTRRIYINGSVPFDEANFLQFPYSDEWQLNALSSEDGTPYLFYLKKGSNEIKFEVALGSMSEVLSRVNNCLTLMNDAYLKILMITGTSPDSYRDYSFARLIPGAINNLAFSASDLKAVSELLEEITGEKGSHVATLDKIVVLLERMTSDEDEIAKNLTNLKTYIGTLGTWVLTSRQQPLEFDYMIFQPSGVEYPEANANFFESFGFEFKAFILSFFTDYSTMGATSEIDTDKTVSVWTTAGREKSSIMRQLIDSNFMPEYNISVELKLVSGGILQSTLAGIGPDVATLASADCVNYAIRDAVLPMNELSEFDEVIKRFPESSVNTVTLYGTTYALPSTTSFLMMFYRMDILAELGLEVPRTWDDLIEIIPVLQNNNMTIAFPSKLAGTKLFLYQNGGELYADGGKRINLSSNTALTAFTKLTDLFQSYRFNLTYDFPNRFRTGEMPIGMVDYVTNYNQLTVFAPEIDGLWEFAPLPGFVDEDGNINNCSVVTVSGMCLMRGALDNTEEAWTFIKWYTSADTQSNYSNELVAIVGESSKNSTANIEALERLPWSAREYRNLKAQFDNTVGITEYPGNYIIERYVNFAFLEVYNNGANAVESMLDYVTEINKEITRKRKEFGFDYIEISYSDSAQFIESAD